MDTARLRTTRPIRRLSRLRQRAHRTGQSGARPAQTAIACPTCGTGSGVTGIAIFDLLEQQFKTGIPVAAPVAIARAGGSGRDAHAVAGDHRRQRL